MPADAWRRGAACAGLDPQLFFPDSDGDHLTPKRVCRACPVKEACLAHALAHGEKFGIWGGKSENERRRLRRNEAALARYRVKVAAGG